MQVEMAEFSLENNSHTADLGRISNQLKSLVTTQNMI